MSEGSAIPSEQNMTLSESLEPTSVKPLRVACLIPGHLNSPFAEGLFQYLTLLINGLEPGDIHFSLVVSYGSTPAFELWRDYLPLEQQTDISIISAPDSVAMDLYPPDLERSARDWLVNFEIFVDVWFSIRPDLTVLAAAEKPIVSIFADFIFASYPTLFPPPVYQVEAAYRATVRLSKVIAHYICFSEYVKKYQILPYFDISEDRISVIPHAAFDYREVTKSNISSKVEAANRIREYLAREVVWRDPLQQSLLGEILLRYPFEEVDFIFVSTRARPHKNTVIILRAIEELRKTYRNIKVIVTAPISWVEPRDPFSQAVIAAGLQYEVISLAHLPLDIHAALYRCAAITVHPSPFEGGFPFTAFESISLGTPILISDGAVVREFLSEENRSSFLFDPTSSRDLAKRIIESIDNRESLLREQRGILSTFSRTLKQNSSEILKICRAASQAAPPGIGRVAPGLSVFGIGSVFERGSRGWWQAEDWGRWAREPRAIIRLWRGDDNTSNSLKLRLRVPPHPAGMPFVGDVTITGSEHVIPISEVGEGAHITVVLDDLPLGTIEIVIRTQMLVRPCDHIAGSSDLRRLGFGLEYIQVV